MKRLLLSLFALVAILSASAQFNLGDLLDKVGNKGGDNSGNIGSAISGLIGGVLSNDKIQLSDMQGSWTYNEPAVYFKSDDLLKKAGGAAAAKAVEEKLVPYYKVTGLNTMQLTVNADSTFQMNVRKATLTGTIEFVSNKDQKSNAVFHFKALGRVNLGSMSAYIVKNPANGTIDLMFDVSKLITLADKVSTFTKNSTVTSAVKLLKGYDGLCAGFNLSKSN